ncbi:hypothetical protein [Legionella sp. WA2022007384]
MSWQRLGGGTFNRTYTNGTEVAKISRKDSSSSSKEGVDKADSPERSVRLWNLINPTRATASLFYMPGEGQLGWKCPLIKGRQSTDSEISGALINIFNSTGRVVIDAPSKENFLTTSSGEVVCVDIGLAINLERREDELIASHGRRRSVVSMKAWEELHHIYDSDYFKKSEASHPNTVNTIKALLFIKSTRPDMHDVSFLRHHPDLLKKLALAYDARDHSMARLLDAHARVDTPHVPGPSDHAVSLSSVRVSTSVPPVLEGARVPRPSEHVVTGRHLPEVSPSPERLPVPDRRRGHGVEETRAMLQREDVSSHDLSAFIRRAGTGAFEDDEDEVLVSQGRKILDKQLHPNLKHSKESCLKELQDYINSRGTINDKGDFVPSDRTKYLRNSVVTARKVSIVQGIIDKIKGAHSYEALQAALRPSEQEQGVLNVGCWSSDVNSSLGKCALIADEGFRNHVIAHGHGAISRKVVEEEYDDDLGEYHRFE